MSGYRSDDEAARAKIEALEAELRDSDARLSTLLFSRTPAKPFAPMRVQASPPARRRRETALHILFALSVVAGFLGVGAPIGFALFIAVFAYLALWQTAVARRAREARDIQPPVRDPKEIAALALRVEDRNAQIESLDAQIANERAACADLRKRIDEAELLVNDDSIKNRESSR
ncbi:MAG: hypothetical protein ACREJX_05880 [Polyangiaceae bacterium]